MAIIRAWLSRPPGRLEQYFMSTFFPYHALAVMLLLGVVYWATTSMMPEWVEFSP